MEIFKTTTQIEIGNKIEKVLNELKSKKILIITDAVMIKIGMLDNLKDILEKEKIEYKIFDGVEIDPSFEVVKKALDIFVDFLPEVIIGLGGGSSLDTAKAIKYFIKKSNISIPLIAIPTTCGTGSEVTSYAVLTDKEKNIKIPIKDDEMIPDYAILDAELTKTLPKSVVADSGIDALTHAIEAYTFKNATIYTQIYALYAIKGIFKNLIKMFENIKDDEARIEMAKNSCIAGFAFEKSGLGINHSIAHAIGGKFHIPHGRINGLLLPYVIEFNSKSSEGAIRYWEIAKEIGLPSSSIEEGVKALITAVKVLNKTLGIPACIQEMLIDREKYNSSIDDMSKSALSDICTPGNIRDVEIKDFKDIFEKIY